MELLTTVTHLSVALLMAPEHALATGDGVSYPGFCRHQVKGH